MVCAILLAFAQGMDDPGLIMFHVAAWNLWALLALVFVGPALAEPFNNASAQPMLNIRSQ